MTTETFAEFHARRNAERATEDANRIVWKRAQVPGSTERQIGYVARLGKTESPAYVLRDETGAFAVGRLVGPTREFLAVRTSLDAAKACAEGFLR